ncbi:MAG TPA: transposase [Hymenobacter sp.]|jgi:transposase
MEKPDKCRKYDAAFRTETLRMVAESRSTPVAARALNLYPKLLYKWQRDAQPALPADPAEALKERQLRTANRRLAQELEISKKAIAIFSASPPTL